MALKDIVFNKVDKLYEAVFQLESEQASIHLEFNGEESKCVYLYQSITGDKFVCFDSFYYVSKVYEKNITGGITGQYIKIQCSANPTLAKILV